MSNKTTSVEYRQTEKGKEVAERAYIKYMQSDKGKETTLKYSRSVERKIVSARYCLSEKGKKARTELYRKLRLQIIKRLGGQCVVCGNNDYRVLQIDHVHGGGEQERKFINVWTYYRRILRDICSGRYQLLCANCNAIKKYENREYGGKCENRDDPSNQLPILGG